MEREIQRFNEEASELQRTEFRRARTPGERARMNEHRPRRDYGKLFDPVIPFVEAFVSEDPAGRSKVPSQLSSDALGALRTFAHGAAVVAVRRESPPLIALSLAALAILAAVDDPRDLSFYLATVYYSATKLGLDTQKLFSEAASLCSPGFFRDYMQGFPMLPDRAKELRGFWLRETTSEEGFDIVQDPPGAKLMT